MRITSELIIFSSFFICGIILGIIFDFFRAMRRFLHKGVFPVAVTDISFWTVSTCIFAYCVFYINDGLLCTFVIAGFLLGIVLYFLSVSCLIFNMFFKIIDILSKFLNLFFKILLTPLYFSYKIILVYFFKMKYKFNWGAKKWIWKKMFQIP